MKPPLIRLRMGDLYGQAGEEQLGFLKSLNYTFPDEGTWEVIRGYQKPKNIHIAVNFQVIHYMVPDNYTQFYPDMRNLSKVTSAGAGKVGGDYEYRARHVVVDRQSFTAEKTIPV